MASLIAAHAKVKADDFIAAKPTLLDWPKTIPVSVCCVHLKPDIQNAPFGELLDQPKSGAKFTYDLAVAYRVYPKISTSGNPPPIFPDDKLKLSEFCLRSFKNSLGGLRTKMWAILDDCPPSYEELFRKVWPAEDLVVIKHSPKLGGGGTLYEQVCILVEQTDAEVVHFAEDDYFYLPGQFKIAVDFLKQNPDADFVGPFESHDLYIIDLHNMRFEQREFAGRVWNSCISSTHTFLARRSALIESQNLHHRYYRKRKGGIVNDLSMWVALTKKRIFNPVKFVQWSLTGAWLPGRWFWAASMVIAWYFCWRQILFGRKYKLWSPHPCVANHMNSGMAATGVDWDTEFRRHLESMNAEAAKH